MFFKEAPCSRHRNQKSIYSVDKALSLLNKYSSGFYKALGFLGEIKQEQGGARPGRGRAYSEKNDISEKLLIKI
jgi:hypothetical protein